MPKLIQLIATAIIWGCATGMISISLPLAQEPYQDTVIALAVLIAATVSTVALWRSPVTQPQQIELKQLRDLQERLLNLELIATNGELDWSALRHQSGATGAELPSPRLADRSEAER